MNTQSTSEQSSGNNIGFKSVAKYALLPGIIPMIRRLAERFGHLMHMFTLIFGAVGLIDKNHPCLLSENIGRYRFVDVIGLASKNVIFDKKHIPQVVMFFAVILGIVLVISIIATFLFGIFFQPAQAFAQYFSNPVNGQIVSPPSQDWTYQFLRNVFGKTGLNDIWDGVDNDANFFPTILRKMLTTYSMALMVLAVFMVIYLMTMSLVESARTGKPFGDKFDSIWAPIRLVTAIGLLVPIGGGYNSAQMITFQVAHWSSALATNVWVSGLSAFKPEGLIQATSPDPNYRFIRAYFVIKLCQEGWNKFADHGNTGDKDRVIVRTVPGAVQEKKLMKFRYGTENDPTFCGEIEVPQLNEDEIAALPKLKGMKPAQNITHLAYSIRNLHSSAYGHLRCALKDDIATIVKKYADDKTCSMAEIAEINQPVALRKWIIDEYWAGLGYNGKKFFAKTTASVDNSTCAAGAPMNSDLTAEFSAAGKELVEIMQGGAVHGWAAAGSFYLQLASNLGKLSEAVGVRPKATMMPRILDYKFAIPTKPDAQPITVTAEESEEMCEESKYSASCQLYNMLTDADKWFKTVPLDDPALAKELDYDNLFSLQMRDTTERKSMNSAQEGAEVNDLANIPGIERISDKNLNPLSSLVGMGDSFKNYGMWAYIIGIGVSFFSPTLGDIMFTVGSMYLMAGFTLSFVMPLMPFLNFAFGVLEWVMTVFEAIIGMPLWALSFISREGGWFEGKPMEGIMLLFEMFLRPTILIFSIMGALIIFGAGVDFFNSAFDLYLKTAKETINVSGLFDNIAFTVMYVFVMYSLGNSCFKLITKMPDSFMRWYGKSVNGFGGIMEAGVADVNPYIVSQYGKDLSNQTGNLGRKTVKGYAVGDGEFDGAGNPLKGSMGTNKKAQYTDKDTGEQKEGESKSGGGLAGEWSRWRSQSKNEDLL